VIWVGTDDGNVQITHNDGKDWINTRSNVRGVPDDLWVSRLEASHFAEGTAYLTFDGHRSANLKPWVFKTTDFGNSWTNISSNLPDGNPVYVIKEDLQNPNLLFVGTEFAVFYSINSGKTWTKLNLNMPTVAFHDLVIHPRDNDLVAGTHGRGIWVMDDITPLQQATEDVLASEAFLFKSRKATQWLNINTGGGGGSLYYRGENPNKNAAVNYYLGASATGTVEFEISDITGESKWTYSEKAEPGIHRFYWDMAFDPTRAEIDAFKEQLGQRIDRMASQASGAQVEEFKALRKEIEGVGTNLTRIRLLQSKVNRASGSGRFRRSGLRRSPAKPGEYLVRMTYGGKTYFSSIVIRQDPMLELN